MTGLRTAADALRAAVPRLAAAGVGEPARDAVGIMQHRHTLKHTGRPPAMMWRPF